MTYLCLFMHQAKPKRPEDDGGSGRTMRMTGGKDGSSQPGNNDANQSEPLPKDDGVSRIYYFEAI